MGLAKTIFSPLTNTTPLVSIILAVILVAVFRLSGGGVSIGEVKNKQNATKTVSQKNVVEENNYNLPKSGTFQVDADEINTLLGHGKIKKPTVTPTKERPKNSLSDIEEQLGLKGKED